MNITEQVVGNGKNPSKCSKPSLAKRIELASECGQIFWEISWFDSTNFINCELGSSHYLEK